MARPTLEVADIFRDHGPAWRDANRGHVSLGQLKVMSAIESCRTAALGGHVARCENGACGYTKIAYNSCRNRHCPALFLAPLRKTRWFVYAKRPFAGPKAVLAYLSRYTHRVAISNSRLIKADATSVTFKVKN
jgi:Transposase zinc-binding domain/Putative transposase